MKKLKITTERTWMLTKLSAEADGARRAIPWARQGVTDFLS
jgi:hypothetical protein